MKRGSALLVVLGMVAFMVISAVAFSAYMRYSRLPSSYLRRTSASRHLAHAALAQAIDIIDASIGDNPHPGFGTLSSEYPRENGVTAERNYWRDRCYIGTNQLVSAEETVSTLTLEGLAYIPPSLVNEARYYSRHAASARWQDLGYDAGRFAFFALDVSDCLNVNRVGAKYGRNSSDNGKLSLAFALEDAEHKGGYAVRPSAWDSFMSHSVDFEKVRDGVPDSDVSKMPFVSLADLSLAVFAKAKNLVQYVSPFANYVTNGAEDFVPSETGSESEVLRALNIITDSYFPAMSDGSDTAGDLTREQPFSQIKTGAAQPSNKEILQKAGTGTGRLLEESMTALDMISLYDYLDENDVPASLALPTVERVPMICGLQPALRLSLKPACVPGPETKEGSGTGVAGTYTRTDTFKLTVNGTGALGSLVMFPFRRDKDAPNSGYTVEYAARICFGLATPGLRTSSGSRYVVQTKTDFGATGVKDSMLRPKIPSQSLSFSNVDEPNDALAKQDPAFSFNDVKTWFDGADPLFTVTHKYKKDDEGNVSDDTIIDATVNPDFHPVNADGTGDGGFTADLLKDGGSVTVRPYLTIVARVVHEGKTVDLVPASGLDDQKYNEVNTDLNICNIGGNGSKQPIMTFGGDKDFVFGEGAFAAGETVEIMIQPTGKTSVFCPDPRWNFAPENFLRTSQNLDKSFYTASENPLCGVGGDRDNDIFMFVSNQGYMQSPSEVAFLPRTSAGAMGSGNKITGDCAFSFDKTDFEEENGSDLGKLPHGNLMWQTYRLYQQGGAASDDIYGMGLYDGGRGARVNPYSDSQYVTLAALANTPYSWWAASTNNSDKALEDLSAEDFNKEYAFNEGNSKAKFAWQDLKKVADELRAAMRDKCNGDWAVGWDNKDWAGNSSDFVGVTFEGDTDDLYEIDRKFLYGYWRDCFAAKQQLFLVFVRAEPLMMGGGAIGQTPPQLGARAVALVWRNPAPGTLGNTVGGAAARLASYKANNDVDKTDAKTPHRTRILFYRQFD